MKINRDKKIKKTIILGEMSENIFEPRENQPWFNSTVLTVKQHESSSSTKLTKGNLHSIQKTIKMKRSNNAKEPNLVLKNFTIKSIKTLGNFFRQSVIKLSNFCFFF